MGGVGNDDIRGEAGLDTVSYAVSRMAVMVDLAAGSASGEGTDRLTGVERAKGSALADTLGGSGATNVLSGLGGNDKLLGLAGNDSLNGGDGNDALDGGTGTDTCLQGAGTGTRNACER